MVKLAPTDTAGQGKADGHVVAIANVGDGCPLQSALLLVDGKEIGQRLAGVLVVGQGVDHRHGGVLGQRLQRALGKGAHYDDVDVAGEDASRIGDRLSDSHPNLIFSQVKRMSSKLMHSYVEADLCPQRRLLEEQRRRLARHDLGRRPALEVCSSTNKRFNLLNGEIGYG